MKYYIYRNSTLEPFFSGYNVLFSEYEGLSFESEIADVFIWFYLIPYKDDSRLLSEEIGFYSDNLQFIAKQIPSNKSFYLFTISLPINNEIVLGDTSLRRAVSEYNTLIYDLSQENNNFKIIHFQDFISKFPIDMHIDWKYYYLSKMQLNPRLVKDFSNWFRTQLNILEFSRKKCLVLDLDNTLWGGILGEDGINGIKIGGEYPGNAFLDFQKYLLNLSETGIILTLCSKNNESDVLELWEKNPNLLIKKENVSAYRINWQNKAENIKELANELNIGLDSFVFIDDNPTERELIRQLLPEVETPEFPAQPYQFPVFVRELTEKYFKTYTVTEEDRNKINQYQANRERAKILNSISNFTEYLESLEIEINIQKANSFTVSRIAQMTQKTNQFNLTTKRYTELEIENLLSNNAWIYSISVRDKFGDNGITGAIIIVLNDDRKTAEIDSFLLSCRILGKGIEEAFMGYILNTLKKEGIEKISAVYKPTLKNDQVKNFYDRIGFELTDHPENSEERNYRLDLTVTEFEIKSYYAITES